MAISLVQDGATMGVEWLRPLAARLASLIFLAPALYLGHFLVLGVQQDLSGGNWRSDLPGLLVFLFITLAIAIPGYILATFRYFVDIDKTSGAITVSRRFGPLLHLRFKRKLSEFSFVSIVRDLNQDEKKQSSWFAVNLCGGKTTKPIELASFRQRTEANGFGEKVGAALALKATDFADTEPDEDE